MNKLNGKYQQAELGRDLLDLIFLIDTIISTLDALDSLDAVSDNQYFLQLDAVYCSALNDISTAIERTPSRLVANLKEAMELLPDSLYRQQEIENRWGNIRTLLLSSQANIRQFIESEELAIAEDQQSELLNTSRDISEIINNYTSEMSKVANELNEKDTKKAKGYLSQSSDTSKNTKDAGRLKLTDNVLVVDGFRVVFRKNTKQLELVSYFFGTNGKPKPQKKMLGDIIDKLESFTQNTQTLEHNILNRRLAINKTVKLSSGRDIELLSIEPKQMFINRDLLK
jgi:Mg2+ and Co2+ transporter CorA